MKKTLLVALFLISHVNAYSVTIADLKTGGYIIYFRHGARDEVEPAQLLALDKALACGQGSELNATGIQESIKTADAFKKFAIPVSRVYSSPTCRTRQMGDLMFGSLQEIRKELEISYLVNGEDEQRLFHRFNLVLFTEPPLQASNRVLISHVDIILQFGPSWNLGMGDSAVFQGTGEGAPLFLNFISKAQWLEAAQP